MIANINTVNNDKLKAVKELTAKQISLAILKLWENYYTSLIVKLDIETANSYLNQMKFITENTNTEELNKLNKKALEVRIEQISNEIAIDLRFNLIDLSTSFKDMLVFSIYQKLETFNNMFLIIKDLLNTLNDSQNFKLAVNIVNCKVMINRVILNEDIFKNSPPYKKYLEEKETFFNNINSIVFTDSLKDNIDLYSNKVNEKLEQRNINYIEV